MSAEDLVGTTALVTGASQGFGRAIAEAMVQASLKVVGVARDATALEELREKLGEGFTPVVADVADPGLAAHLIGEHRPGLIVLNAGANPVMKPIREQTWETFATNWEVDTKQVFHWVQQALLQPLPPGSTVISFSSGAALNGSPLSGGYAGAKAAVRFISAYAAGESARAGLGIRFVSVLPKLTPDTALGASGVAAYAALQGVDVATFLAGLGTTLGPAQVADRILELAADPGSEHPAYLLTPAGLNPLG